jgi:phosphate-selective porin OprO/OprP
LGIGINWFLNKNVVISTEYDQTSFVGGCSTGGLQAAVTPGCLTAGIEATASTSRILNRPNEKVIMQRFQLSF